MKALSSFILLVFLVSSGCKQVDYDLIESFQDNNVPELELNISDTTKVLLVFCHADDEIAVAGLVAFLKEKGAEIHLLTLGHHPLQKDIKTRMKELNCSVKELGIKEFEVSGLFTSTWEETLQNKVIWYDMKDSIKNIIHRKIDNFMPDILITWDNEIGGYGHPEHRISAQLTEDLFIENQYNPNFSVKTILQFTLPDKLEKFLVSENDGYKLAKELTGTDGLPDPDYSLDITNYWETKNNVAQCYQSVMYTMKHFFLTYDKKNKESHIKAFSKEYYTVTTK
ncbi:MAG: PIG-L family deacetylase [Bacteroidota bacterium]|nr:PIG-L family deacetylase [Bacteroidota bacterium]